MIEGTTQLLLKNLVDDTQERFEMVVENSLKIHMEHTKKTHQKNANNFIRESMEKANITKKDITENRHFGRLDGSFGTFAK